MTTAAAAVISGFLVSLLSLLPVAGSQGLVSRNTVLEVPNGRVAYLRQELLSFHVLPGQVCKVEVITTEPMHQRVGKLRPQVFDCDFLPKSTRYEHNGSPLLEEDSVKMRAFVLLENRTLEETFTLKIRVVNSRCDVIQVSGTELVVPENSRYSNPINADIVQFHYDRVRFMHRCRIRVYRERGFPIAGRIVRVTSDGESRVVEIDDHSEEMDCDEFLLLNIKYEYDWYSHSPNMDYVPIHVIVSDSRSAYVVTEERHWFPISLIGKSQNFPPYIDSSVRRSFEVDEFILTNILPNTVSVRDVETVQKNMIYNITSSPREGFITHLSDETQPIQSFLQQDVATMSIGYQPPNISYPERRTYDVEMTALDAFFQPSRPFTVGVSVRNTDTNAPRILWNMGLTLLEGQCRPINKEVLKIMDRDNLQQVRVTLAAGPQHGNLLVNGRPGYTFTWEDLGQEGSVSYCHDDSDTRSDSITFRLTDIYHSTRFKLPIRVLPKDDAPPFLISNIVLRGNEGENILINRKLLEASDLDSDPAFITFNITRPPMAGEVQKKRDWEKVGWSVDSFVQSDLFQGLISYKHMGKEIFEDFFEFVLIDSNRPVPNISPVLRVDINIDPVDDLPPQPGPGNSLTLTMRETDLFILTPRQLHHFDVEHPGEDLQYEIIGGCHREGDSGGVEVDAGRIISLEHVPMPMKDPTLPSISTFTQKSINHSKIAYMPPVADIGLYPQHIRFYFIVTSSSGIKLGPKQFTIEVLPVDNEIPSINLLPLTIREGEVTDISSDSVFIHDPDTALSDLSVIVSEPPQFGELILDGRTLSTGDRFSDSDLEKSRLQYKHDGSESMNDQLMFTVSDGRHNSSAFMTIMVEGVDDEMPKIIEGNARLTLDEKSSVLISTENLSATDVDTTDNFLVFDVLEYPKQGNIQIGANPTLRFTQQDIIEGNVRYVHNDEIGKNEAFDSFTVMVSDRHQPDSAATSDEMEAAMKTIEITVSPIDDQPPKVLIGEQVLKCDEAERTLLTVEYLNAEDVDTEVSQLTFHISSPPTFGYIEDRTPRPGYEKIIGKRSDSFTYQQLLLNYISYVQSNHSGIEPTSDNFLFYVSDGIHNSIEVPFLISILPQNDEPPNLICSNLTCMEGSMAPLVLVIEDLDVPHDHVMVVVTKRPSHGMIMNEMENFKRKRSSHSRRSTDDHSHMVSVEEFSMHDLHSRQIVPAYLHDGSENFNDDFELKITDGKHEKKQNLNIKVVGVNDQRPELLTNVELKVNPGESAIITNRYLHAYDRDTYPGNIDYIINVLPRRGTLLKQESDGQWRSLDVADYFTEYDVVLNRVKYQHETGLGHKPQDSFSFHVSDGILSTRKKTFSIFIFYEYQQPLHVETNTLTLEQNQKKLITTEILTTKFGGTRDPRKVSYRIIKQPRYGSIEYLQFPGVPIDHFTQLDLVAGKVAYAHITEAGEDFSIVAANNGLRTKTATVNFEIIKVDRELPRLVLNNSTLSTYEEKKSIVVFRGTTMAINSVIDITDTDTEDESLYMQITKLPVHGKLLIGDRNATQWDNITKSELRRRQLSYQHNRNDPQIMDYFDFTVHDGTNDGYVFLGTPRISQSTRLFISIEELDQEAPEVVVNKQPYDIKSIHEKRKNSKLYLSIDRNYLRAEDKGIAASSQYPKFVVTRKPLYGIVKKFSNGIWRSCERFTQDQLNHGWVRYVISKQLRVTNDSFMFSVQDYWGNKLQNQRFQMSWSRLSVNVSKTLKICEGNKLSIGFVRSGNLNVSSFISASILSKSMKEGVDYASNCTKLLQFDPGVSEKTWHVWTLDNHLEGRVKKMKVRFRNAVNSLFLRKKAVRIAMLDASNRRCSKRERKSKKKSKKVQHKIANDRPTTAILQKHLKVKGTRIYPQSYFSNGTDRVWTINAISTITINDGETDQPTLQRKVPQDEAFIEPALLLAEVSHEPIESYSQSQVNNASSVQVPRRCTLANQGEVFYYSESHLLLECNGAEWLTWRPKTKQQNQTTTTVVCDTGWKALNDRCIYISDGRSEYDQSWNSASRACRELHSASLIAVRNKRELSQLWKMTKKSSFWFGLNRKLNPSKWEWSIDEELTYLNWKQNYPKKRDECAYVGPRKLWRSSACDIRHKQKIKYVCSKSA